MIRYFTFAVIVVLMPLSLQVTAAEYDPCRWILSSDPEPEINKLFESARPASISKEAWRRIGKYNQELVIRGTLPLANLTEPKAYVGTYWKSGKSLIALEYRINKFMFFTLKGKPLKQADTRNWLARRLFAFGTDVLDLEDGRLVLVSGHIDRVGSPAIQAEVCSEAQARIMRQARSFK